LNKEEILSEIRRTIKESISAFNNLYSNIDESFADAVELILNSNKIFISGVGKSGLIARKIVGTFSSIGIPTFFLNPVEALHGDIGVLQKNDCVIFLSKSGTTEEIIHLIPYIKNRKLKIISIVSNLDSYIAKKSDIVLNGYVEKESCPFNIAPTTSSQVHLAIGDSLAVSLMKAKKMTINDFAKNHPLGQIGKNLTLKVADVMHKGKALPVVFENEKFKNALIEMTKKGLGVVCVTDEQSLLKGIITDGDVRRLLNKTDDLKGLTVNDVMTKNPITCSADNFLGEALSIMENRPSQINVLPVVNSKGRYIGVIRLHDIIRSGF